MISSLAYRSSLAGYDVQDSVRAIALYMAFVIVQIVFYNLNDSLLSVKRPSSIVTYPQ